MITITRRTITWSLSLATVSAVGLWFGLLVCRSLQQQQAVAAVEQIEVEAYVCALGAESGPCAAYFVRNKVRSPIEFESNGPEWLRARLTEDWCHHWLDTPVAVDVVGSEANDADLQHLARFPRLKKLRLFSTKVTDAGLVVLRRLPALEVLDVGSQTISDAGLDHLERLTRLRALGLWGPITDAGLRKVSRLPELRVLQICSDAITDSGVRSLARMERLEMLSISGGAITDSGVRELGRLPQLRKLSLSGIRDISPNCFDHLRVARPGLDVAYEPNPPEA